MDKLIGTPYFLLHENAIRENIEGFRSALDELWPNSIIAYSEKTNALPWILQWMNQNGVFAEVVSDAEYEVALLSGFPDDHIIFNGPIKGDSYLRRALGNGAYVNIDSAHEVEMIEKEQPMIKGRLGIRVNVNPILFNVDDVGYQEDGFRFGFSEESGELGAVLEKLSGIYGRKEFGLHLHVNSVTRSLAVYRVIANYAAQIIQKHNLTPSYLDIGGGFFGGIQGKPTPWEYIETIKQELDNTVDILNTKLIIEPGSAAIGSAVELHTTVLDVKDTECARIVTTDGSRIHIDPLWQKKKYVYSTDAKKPAYPKQVICGYTCMDHDRIMVIENQPELSVDDQIIYHRVGNYTVTLGGPFIVPFPAVYVECKSNLRMIRKPMEITDYFKMETIDNELSNV